MGNYDYYGNNDCWILIIQKGAPFCFETKRTNGNIEDVRNLIKAFAEKEHAIDPYTGEAASVSFIKGALFTEGVSEGRRFSCIAVNEDHAEIVDCRKLTEDIKKQAETVSDSFKVRPLTEKDAEETGKLDDLSGFELKNWVADTGPEDDPFAWGLFLDGRLVGYCSIGGADDVCDSIDRNPLHTSNSLLLSDVYLVPDCRHQDLGSRMVKEAIEKRWELDGSREAVFLICIHDRVRSVYEKIGFVSIPSKPWDGAMVLIPDEN